MKDPMSVRINLATPFRGSRMAGTALPTRGEESVRRFIGGFITGAALAAAVGMIAAALGVLAPANPGTDRWAPVLEQELARVDGVLRPSLEPVARLGIALRTVEQIAAEGDFVSRLVGSEGPSPAERRAARLLAMDLRSRLTAELAAWDQRAIEVAALPPAARDSAVRVLGLLRWQVDGGELARALQSYEEDVTTAQRHITATAAALPTPTPTAAAKSR